MRPGGVRANVPVQDGEQGVSRCRHHAGLTQSRNSLFHRWRHRSAGGGGMNRVEQIAGCLRACLHPFRETYVKCPLNAGEQLNPSQAIKAQFPVQQAVERYRRRGGPAWMQFGCHALHDFKENADRIARAFCFMFIAVHGALSAMMNSVCCAGLACRAAGIRQRCDAS